MSVRNSFSRPDQSRGPQKALGIDDWSKPLYNDEFLRSARMREVKLKNLKEIQKTDPQNKSLQGEIDKLENKLNQMKEFTQASISVFRDTVKSFTSVGSGYNNV